MTLGGYPPLTVDSARKAALRVLGAVEHGRDPAAERDKQRAAPTVAMLAEQWLEQHVRPKLKASTVAMNEWLLRKHVLPTFGRRLAKDVTRTDVVHFHAKLKGTPFNANRALGTLREVLGFGEKDGVLPANPARGVKQYKEPKRERYLSDAELERLGKALAEVEQEGAEEPQAIAALRLLLFTGCRRGEILGARWRDVNTERGVLHLRDAKAGPRDVPLNAPALEVLQSLPREGEWIIPRRVAQSPLRLVRVWHRVRDRAGLSRSGTTLAGGLPSSPAAMREPTSSVARRSGSSARCAYLAVVDGRPEVNAERRRWDPDGVDLYPTQKESLHGTPRHPPSELSKRRAIDSDAPEWL